MRKFSFIILTLLLMGLFTSGREAWRAWRLEKLHTTGQARIVQEGELLGEPGETVVATYRFQVGNKSYEGTLETVPGKLGSSVTCHYHPADPSLNCVQDPSFLRRRAVQDVWFFGGASGLLVLLIYWARHRRQLNGRGQDLGMNWEASGVD